MIRIIVADDHEIFREGLLRMFSSASHIEVVGDAGDGEKALQLILMKNPDVAVIDISMPRIDGSQIIERMHGTHPDVKVIFLTMHNNPSLVDKAIKLGASGYVLKDNTFKDLIYAIEKVMMNKKFISSTVSENMLSGSQEEPVEKLLLLTKREREILHYIALGQKNKDIADKLNISIKTVESHRMKIMEKLDLHSVAELVRYAVKSGLF